MLSISVTIYGPMGRSHKKRNPFPLPVCDYMIYKWAFIELSKGNHFRNTRRVNGNIFIEKKLILPGSIGHFPDSHCSQVSDAVVHQKLSPSSVVQAEYVPDPEKNINAMLKTNNGVQLTTVCSIKLS